METFEYDLACMNCSVLPTCLMQQVRLLHEKSMKPNISTYELVTLSKTIQELISSIDEKFYRPWREDASWEEYRKTLSQAPPPEKPGKKSFGIF